MVTPKALEAWRPPRPGQRGRPRDYLEVAIETGHLLRLAFGRPWRQTEGLLRSITVLLGLEVGMPDHTTFARRSPDALTHRSRFSMLCYALQDVMSGLDWSRRLRRYAGNQASRICQRRRGAAQP